MAAAEKGELMRFEGAVVKEQGVTFGVLMVKRPVLRDATRRSEMRAFGTRAWGRMPIVLAAQDGSGRFEFQGRRDIVNFLASIDPARVPWAEWQV